MTQSCMLNSWRPRLLIGLIYPPCPPPVRGYAVQCDDDDVYYPRGQSSDCTSRMTFLKRFKCPSNIGSDSHQQPRQQRTLGCGTSAMAPMVEGPDPGCQKPCEGRCNAVGAVDGLPLSKVCVLQAKRYHHRHSVCASMKVFCLCSHSWVPGSRDQRP